MTWRIVLWVGALALVAAVYVVGHRHGVSEIEQALQADRVQVLKDGKEIDSVVEGLDRDGLCAVLGGCAVHDADSD